MPPGASPARPLAASSVVATIHDAVRGRARFRVPGLRRSKALKVHLESRLLAFPGIGPVSASTVTGHLLVFYNSLQSSRSVKSCVEAVLGAAAGKGTPAPPSPVPQVAAPRPRPPGASVPRPASATPALSWHALDRQEVVQALTTSPAGLSQKEADRRLARYGPNLLPEAVPRSPWRVLAEQLASVPVALLAGAAVLSAATGGLVDAVVIMGVVGINAAIGYVTESQTERTIHALKDLVRPRALTLRDGQVRDTGVEELVPGDVLVLRPGQYVAADARLVESARLSIDESALTGESVPAAKQAEVTVEAAMPLPDRCNMVYLGTLVTGGQGLAVVTATGSQTEVGAIQTMVGRETAPATPMEQQLDRLGTQMSVVSGVLCGLVFVLGLLRGQGFIPMLKAAISLAVAAVPEGLPTVATTTLALGVRAMRRRGVLVRHLDAIEALGATQVLCLDKTGTITANRMTVVEVLVGGRSHALDGPRAPLSLGDGEGLANEARALAAVACLCTESEVIPGEGEVVVSGSPTEKALVHMAMDAGLDVAAMLLALPRASILHRAEGRNLMVTLHTNGGGPRLAAVKGSPLEVLALASCHMQGGEVRPLDDETREFLRQENEVMAGKALRVLGLAYALLDEDDSVTDAEALAGCQLTWLGLVGMADPVRPGVRALIARFHRAGVKTVMITGDQSPTAYAVGKALDISGSEPLGILDSTTFSHLPPEALQALAAQAAVFSRVSPAHKLEIVRALQASGRVVAMTGDGINDGPALKAADIGIAMGGTGTDVAREVADVILEDDQLDTMLEAVAQGRTIHGNVRKALHFLLATNLSEIIVVFAANAAGLGQPLTEMQLLWINLVTDIFPGLALSLEPAEADVLWQPPRDPREPIVHRAHLARLGREAAVLGASSLAAYGYGLARYGRGPRAGGLAFLSLTIGQLLHALSCRSDRHTVLDYGHLAPNRHLSRALLGSLALQGAAILVPGLRSFLGVAALGVSDLLVVGAAAGLPLVVNETVKKATTARRPPATPLPPVPAC
ncbi:MAG: HAD-IC family P-type ATPase [Thermodesulfobacteriota bacterium]